MERGHRSTPLLQSRFVEGSPMLSRDGRWIAYRSDEADSLEIWVRPFPNVGEGKWQITTSGGAAPLWASSGHELFYRAGDSMMVVPIETEPTFKYGKPQVLFTKSYIANMQNVDISPDGQRFLIIKDDALTPESSEFDEISVVLNWTEELKRLVPPK